MTTLPPVEIIEAAGKLHEANHTYIEAFIKFAEICKDFSEKHEEFKPTWLEEWVLLASQSHNFFDNVCGFTKDVAVESVAEIRREQAENN